MKIIAVCTTLLTMFVAIGTGVAQNGNALQRYRVLYEVDPNRILSRDDLDFLRALREGVRPYGMSLLFERVETCPSEEALTDDTIACVFRWFPWDPDENLMYLVPRFLPLNNISPVLMAKGQYVMGVENSIVVLVYATGRCGDVRSTLSTWAAQEERNRLSIEGVNYFLGNCALASGDYEDAARRFTTLRSLQSSGGGHYYIWSAVNAAWTFIQLGRADEAFALMDSVLNDTRTFFEEDLPFVLTKRSQLYALDFQFDNAIADMTTAIEVAKANPDTTPETLAHLYTERGQRILLLYEWDRVLADYDQAITISPDYAPAYYYRAILFYTQGPREQAIADFSRYLELAPDGTFAADAATYIDDIEAQLTALDG